MNNTNIKKPTKNKPDYGLYKSKEELYFSWYCEELLHKGYLKCFKYEPEPFILSNSHKIIETKEVQLKTKSKIVNKEKTILREHIYTVDFFLEFNTIPESLKDNVFITKDNKWYVEVKGSYDYENMSRLFIINQKWIFQKFGIIVQMINPLKLFENTFTPERYLLTDAGRYERLIAWDIKKLI